MPKIPFRAVAAGVALALTVATTTPVTAQVVFSTSNSPHIDLEEEAARTDTLDRNLAALLGPSAPSIEPARGKALSRALRIPSGPTRPDMAYSAVFVASQPVATGDAQWRCLTEALYFEARGEGVEGLFAVAEVILNRVDSGRFPSDVCGVVNQGTGKKYQCQFSYTCDGRAEVVREPAAWSRVGKVARMMLDGAGRQLTGGALYYHTKAVAPRWSRVFDRTTTIGAHHFYSQG